MEGQPQETSRSTSPVALPVLLRLVRRLNLPHKLGLCERAFGRHLSQFGICWVQTSIGPVWKLDLRNPTHRWIVYGEYEGAGFLQWTRSWMRPDAVIIDSGANIGQMLLYLAGIAPLGKIYAFEPGAAAREWLLECLAQTTMPVEVVPVALGERSESLYLRAAGPEAIHGAWNQISSTEGEPVEVVSLDHFTASRGIPHVDLWKLDIEGYELAALRGAQQMLRERRITALRVELTSASAEGIIAYLGSFGYRMHLVDPSGRLYVPRTLPEHTNGVFLPDEALPHLRQDEYAQ